MNELNYASLEASKKLVDARIVLETESYWVRVANSPIMLNNNRYAADEYYPAPSMAEVWRELPPGIEVDGEKYNLCAHKIGGVNCAEYVSDLPETVGSAYGANMSDNLIELLIWVRKVK